MWLFTRYGFFSISVQGNTAIVRARMREHLVALQDRFPLCASIHRGAIQSTEDRDYAWRISVPLKVWAKAVEQLVLEQTWSNFKNEAARFGKEKDLPGRYNLLLHEVWMLVARKLQWSKQPLGSYQTYTEPEFTPDDLEE